MKKRIISIFICSILIFGNFASVIAATKTELENQGAIVDVQLEEAEEHLEELNVNMTEALTELNNINAQISDCESEIEELEAQIEELETQIEEQNNKINELQEKYDEENELLKERLVASYECGEISFLDVLFSSESLTDFISNYYIVTEIMDSNVKLLESIEEQKEEVERIKAKLELDEASVKNSKNTVEAKRKSLTVLRKQQNIAINNLTEEEKKIQQDIDDLNAIKEAIENEIKDIARREAEAAKKNNNTSSIISTPSASGYIKPISGYNITTGYGSYRTRPGKHTGVDYSGSGISGTPIYAVKDGTVEISIAKKNAKGQYISYGEYILINHHDGTMTLYAHGAPGSRLVEKGDKVKQGQKIMSVGTTGNSTGYHLHFEVWLNGVNVDPTPYLP